MNNCRDLEIYVMGHSRSLNYHSIKRTGIPSRLVTMAKSWHCFRHKARHWSKIVVGRFRYLTSVSVFGIFIGIFFKSVRYSVFQNIARFGSMFRYFSWPALRAG